MKKVKMFRSSGQVVDPELLKQFKAEFTENFDRLTYKHGKNMEAMQADLEALDKVLGDKYNKTVVEVDFVKTKKGWIDLMDTYGNIIVSRSKETGEILYIIFDE